MLGLKVGCGYAGRVDLWITQNVVCTRASHSIGQCLALTNFKFGEKQKDREHINTKMRWEATIMINFNQWLKTFQGIGTIILFISIALIVYILRSPWAYRELTDGFYLGFFPALSLALIAFSSLVLIVEKDRKMIPDDLRTMTLKVLIGILVLLGAGWAYFEVQLRFGYLFTTPVFLFINFYILGLGHWSRCIIWSVVMSVATYAVLSVIGVQLP